jgi:hypothetical protein
MKWTRFSPAALMASLLAIGMAFATSHAIATPVINGAVLYPRHFNDCPGTTLKSFNGYPSTLGFSEAGLTCSSGINLHDWDLSADGGASSAVFNNGDAFRLRATLTLTNQRGPGVEGGLRISPWWDQFASGYFNVRLNDGEIACFGGVLPFFSFTSAFGILYQERVPIRLEVIYLPHSNTADDPATIEYQVLWKNVLYSSGPLAFFNCDFGDPSHGCYGIMDDARVGGRVQTNFFAGTGAKGSNDSGVFLSLTFVALPPSASSSASGRATPAVLDAPTPPTTWGRVKAVYR